MKKQQKQMSIDDLKLFLEEKNDIAFGYDAIDSRKNTSDDLLYYLTTKRHSANKWIEIYKNPKSEDGTFNIYLVQEHDILRAWIGCTPEAVEDHLRKEFSIQPRHSQQVRLF